MLDVDTDKEVERKAKNMSKNFNESDKELA